MANKVAKERCFLRYGFAIASRLKHGLFVTVHIGKLNFEKLLKKMKQNSGIVVILCVESSCRVFLVTVVLEVLLNYVYAGLHLTLFKLGKNRLSKIVIQIKLKESPSKMLDFYMKEHVVVRFDILFFTL